MFRVVSPKSMLVILVSTRYTNVATFVRSAFFEIINCYLRHTVLRPTLAPLQLGRSATAAMTLPTNGAPPAVDPRITVYTAISALTRLECTINTRTCRISHPKAAAVERSNHLHLLRVRLTVTPWRHHGAGRVVFHFRSERRERCS